MILKAKLITYNTIRNDDGVIVGGYHEVHNIKCLQNIEHLVANICDVIKNNLLYGCRDTVLEAVECAVNDMNVAKFIKENSKTLFMGFELEFIIGFDPNL